MSKTLPIADLLPQRSANTSTPTENLANPCESLAGQGNGAKQGATESSNAPGKRSATTNPFLGLDDVVALTAIPARTLRHGAKNGKYPGAEKRPGNGGDSWFIPLRALPAEAQARYMVQQARAMAPAAPAPRLSEDEREAFWGRVKTATQKCADRAEKALLVLLFFFEQLANGTCKMDVYAAIKEKFNVSRATLMRWQEAVDGLDKSDWLPALVPDFSGRTNRPPAEWPGDSWRFFCQKAGTPGRGVKRALDETAREASRQGWGSLPSLTTARNHWRDNVSDAVKAELRGDKKALKALMPTVCRDYAAFALHECWSMDARHVDVQVSPGVGIMGIKGRSHRPWFYAIIDFRSRYVVGYAFGWELNTDLVRAALRNAFETTGRVIPQRAQMDNGREVTAKEITGGTDWRLRGKVKDGEIIGILPLLGVAVDFATPANGQSKPVERLFGTLAGIEPGFREAYLGNNPQARPEEHDPACFVTAEELVSAYREEIVRYHNTPHRGDAMNGRTPLQVYNELMRAPGFVPRRMTESQYRWTALSAKAVRLSKNGTFELYGHRYWSNETAAAPKGDFGYYAMYHPEDFSAPVSLYRKNKLIAENIQQQHRASGKNKEDARLIAKKKNDFKRSVKAQAKALKDYEVTIPVAPEASREVEEAMKALPVANVTALVPSVVEMPRQKTAAEEAEAARIEAALKKMEAENFERTRARFAALQEPKKRASGV
ncbi:hypothetical protein AGMMS49543_23750 [Betaproteobacteria bacterium]|nr:hypothetical protein AGMMS49543_23750 [Betaproteobacteria bacterium]GHU19521.1 hypothetical protein AGMMS50243_11740 [Betaproteobacteria bacterium]